MTEATTPSTKDEGASSEDKIKKVLYDPEGIAGSYFGGRLKFRTKIVWPNLIFFLLIHICGIYGFWLVLCQFVKLQFLTGVYCKFLNLRKLFAVLRRCETVTERFIANMVSGV